MSTPVAVSPMVSIVMPTYNQAQFLAEALDSVFGQTFQNFELIVVNDGSTDATPQILAEYQQRYNFQVINQQNQKLPRALNTGFNAARGKYLTWTSSDNNLLPTMLERLVYTLDTNPQVGLVYGDWEVINDAGQLLGVVRTLDFDRLVLLRTNYINACFMYRRSCQEAVGLYNPDFFYVEDWEYWLRIARSFTMMRVPEVLYQYRVHDKSLTAQQNAKSALARNQRYKEGYDKLTGVLRAQPIAWYWSHIKLRWLKWKYKSEALPPVELRGEYL